MLRVSSFGACHAANPVGVLRRWRGLHRGGRSSGTWSASTRGRSRCPLKAAGSDDSSSICRDMWEKVDFNSSSCCRVRSWKMMRKCSRQWLYSWPCCRSLKGKSCWKLQDERRLCLCMFVPTLEISQARQIHLSTFLVMPFWIDYSHGECFNVARGRYQRMCQCSWKRLWNATATSPDSLFLVWSFRQDIELLETLLLQPQDPNAVGEALMQSCDSLGAVKWIGLGVILGWAFDFALVPECDDGNIYRTHLKYPTMSGKK